MRISQVIRNIAHTVVLLALAAAADRASAGEKPVATVGAQRTHLSFKVSDAAVQKQNCYPTDGMLVRAIPVRPRMPI